MQEEFYYNSGIVLKSDQNGGHFMNEPLKMEPMMNAPTGGLFGASGAQDYPPVGSGPAMNAKGGMPFEQHNQQQIMQSQHMNTGIQQMPYGHQQQHPVMNQGPNMYQVKFSF